MVYQEQQWYYLTYSSEDKGICTFPKGISPKVNLKAPGDRTRILASCNHFFHSASRTNPSEISISKFGELITAHILIY